MLAARVHTSGDNAEFRSERRRFRPKAAKLDDPSPACVAPPYHQIGYDLRINDGAALGIASDAGGILDDFGFRAADSPVAFLPGVGRQDDGAVGAASPLP